jgi:hypothetical protein
MTCDTHRHSPAAADALPSAVLLRLRLRHCLADALVDAPGYHVIPSAAHAGKTSPKKTLRANPTNLRLGLADVLG